MRAAAARTRASGAPPWKGTGSRTRIWPTRWSCCAKRAPSTIRWNAHAIMASGRSMPWAGSAAAPPRPPWSRPSSSRSPGPIEEAVMAIKAIDHVNIRTGKLTESIAFYRDALGMDVRPLPGMDDMDRGAWVYAGDGRPVVHLNSAEDGADFLGEVRDWQGLSGSARVHHVAFDCDDYDGFRAQLTESGFTV